MNVLIYSSASSISTNRAYIRDLATNHSVNIHLCILHRQNDEDAKKSINTQNEPFTISLHKLNGIHSRLETVSRIKSTIEKFSPVHIILEFDPASKLVNDVINCAKKNNPKNYFTNIELFKKE